MKLLKPCCDRGKSTQQRPLELRPTFAQLSAIWSSPLTFAYVAEITQSLISWRIPTFSCFDGGIFDLLSISQASLRPVVSTSASSVALPAVRYESLHATWPGPGPT